MQRFTLLAMVVALLLATGCRNQQKAELTPVPEPVAVSDPYPGTYGSGAYGSPQPVAVAAAPAPEPIVVAPAGRTHTVAKGDTLWSIAVRHYGNGQRWQDIAAANPGVNPNRLLVGQTLTLP